MLVIYSSVHGQAEVIARRVAEIADSRAVVRDLRDATAADLWGADSVLIVASIHYARHARALIRFVKNHRDRLTAMDSALISVSGDAADPARCCAL